MARKKATPAAPGGGFSLDGGGPSMVHASGGGGFSLDVVKKGPDRPITAPLPTQGPPGEPLGLQDEVTEELRQLQEQFQSPKLDRAEFNLKKQREEARKELGLDATYWVGLVFATTEDLNVFLSKLQVPVFGQFLDGYEVAARVGIPVTRTPLDFPRVNVLDMWSDLALEVPPPPDPSVPLDFDSAFE